MGSYAFRLDLNSRALSSLLVKVGWNQPLLFKFLPMQQPTKELSITCPIPRCAKQPDKKLPLNQGKPLLRKEFIRIPFNKGTWKNLQFMNPEKIKILKVPHSLLKTGIRLAVVLSFGKCLFGIPILLP